MNIRNKGISSVEVEWISKFLSDCPEAAQNVHKYLQKNYSNQQQQLMQPVNSTPKRGHPLDERGGSVNNRSGRHKYPRRGFQQNTQNYTRDNQQDTRKKTSTAFVPSSVRCITTASLELKCNRMQTYSL
jgi:hypothetical protein